MQRPEKIFAIVLVFLGIMSSASQAVAPVLKTGQIKSYDENGIIVTDRSLKDDGYYRAGKMRSYSRRGEVVVDNATGLQWQDNEVVQRVGDGFGFMDDAEDYCSKLTLDDGYWHLPSIHELNTLVDRSRHNPSLTQGIFQNTFLGDYWSSTDKSDASFSEAWFVQFRKGISYYKSVGETSAVRCVKWKSWAPPNFVRISNNTIIDNATGLQWQDDSTAKNIQITWEGAVSYCENTLTLGDYDDWRLPNINELLSIVDYAEFDPALNERFKNHTSSNYWSSTTPFVQFDNAWSIDFSDGFIFYHTKTEDTLYVRCVRGGELESTVNPAIIMYLLD